MLLRGIARESGGWTRCFYAHWSRKLQPQWPAVPQGAALLARSLALGALAGARLYRVGVRGPCTDPSLPSVRSHAMARPSRAPNRAR